VNADRFQTESLLGNPGDNMLGGMPACNMQPLLSVHPGNVRSIAERLIKSVDYLVFDNFDIENIALTNPALVGRLPSFIGMEYDGFYRDRAVADRLDFDFNLTSIRICPI